MLGVKNQLLAICTGWIALIGVTSTDTLAQSNEEIPSGKSIRLLIPAGTEMGFGAGYVLPHRSLMQHLITDHSKHISVAYGKNMIGGWTEGRNAKGMHWQGIEMGWTNLGGEALGSIVSALWITRFPASKRGKGEVGV